jgi:hypothetical protein
MATAYPCHAATPSTRTMRTLKAALALTLAGLASSPALAANLLSNGNFDVVGPLGPIVDSQVPGGSGYSAAQDWLSLGNGVGYVKTELMPSTRVPGGRMIRVQTSGTINGLQQIFGEFNTGPRKAYACVWIRLIVGSVGIGLGNGGGTNGNDVVLNKKDTWEVLQVSNAVAPVNSIVIGALTGGAEFYVESAYVDTKRVNCKAS